MRNNIQNEYLNWMCGYIQAPCYITGCATNKYSKLIQHLYHTEFYYINPMDANRYEDGIALRYRFGREKGYDDPIIAHYLDVDSCSVLEMMVALAIRCEEHIIYDDEIEHQVGLLFWEMIKNLGVFDMSNHIYDDAYVDNVLTNFLERNYDSDGRGGLFWIKGCDKDLRSVEIWYQLNWYLKDIYREEE